MKRIFVIIVALLIPAFYVTVGAQMQQTVSGTVVDKYKKTPLDGISVWAYDNMYVAKDKLNELKATIGTGLAFDPAAIDVRTEDGVFSVEVSPEGAVILYNMDAPLAEPQLIPVKGRISLGTIGFETGAVLEKAVVEAELEPIPEFPVPIFDGESISGGATIPIGPYLHTDVSTSRVVFQSYLLDVNSKDTVMFRKPLVFDGKEYHETQFRHRGFDSSNDLLYQIADESGKSLTSDMEFVRYNDQVKLPDPKRLYFYNCSLWIEDYNKVYYELKDTTCFRSDRLAVPMRFLEYELDDYELDPEDFKKKAPKEPMETPGSLNLKFLEGKSVIDFSDAQSVSDLDSLKQMLRSSIGKGSVLTYFGITGVASPEGRYERNVELANSRMRYVASEALSVLPQYYRDRTNKGMSANVAGWDQVAALLERDGFADEAKSVMEVVDRFADSKGMSKGQSMDRQCDAIRALPFYKSLIVPRLPELRTVTFTIKVTVSRELTPEEVYAKYLEHPDDYRTGKVTLLYEYWHLFNQVKDEEALMDLYRAARKVSIAARKPWELPSNLLAVALLKKDEPDSTILAPFIDLAFRRVDFELKKDGRVDRVLNNQVICANQVKTMLKLKSYKRAGQISMILPDTKYHDLIQVTKCLAGYWQKDEKLCEDIIASSPRNAVVMYMAKNKLNQARSLAEELSEEDPVTFYLRAQILSRLFDQDYGRMKSSTDDMTDLNVLEMATYYLNKAFLMNPALIEEAQSDYYIPEKLLADANKPEVNNPFGDLLDKAAEMQKRQEAIQKVVDRFHKTPEEASQMLQESLDMGMTVEDFLESLGIFD